MRNKLYKILATGIALAITFTLSCSGSIDDPNDGGGGGGEYAITLGIKTITPISVTVIEPGNYCQKDGTLKEGGDEYEASYSINDGTLIFGDAEFNGNQSSLIGTWNASSLQEVEFTSGSGGIGYGNVQKAVFTQNALTLTRCLKIGEDDEWDEDGITVKTRNIDCATREYTYAKGDETVKRMRYYSTPWKQTYTYNGKTCTLTQPQPSKTQEIAACAAAYNKAKAEGDTSGGCSCTHSSMGCGSSGSINGDGSEAGSSQTVCRYYMETFSDEKTLFDCLNNHNFPQWFINS